MEIIEWTKILVYEDTNELIDHHISILFGLFSLLIDSMNALRQLINDLRPIFEIVTKTHQSMGHSSNSFFGNKIKSASD